jgi:hypothetical protein
MLPDFTPKVFFRQHIIYWAALPIENYLRLGIQTYKLMESLVLTRAHGIIGTRESSWDHWYSRELMGSIILTEAQGIIGTFEAHGIIRSQWSSGDHWYLLELMGSLVLLKLFGSLVLTEAHGIISTRPWNLWHQVTNYSWWNHCTHLNLLTLVVSCHDD